MYWQSTTLGKICDQVGGIIQTGPFGSQLHESDYSQEGIPVIMPKDIIEGRIVTDSIARVSLDHVERLSRHKVKPGDIVYGRRGDIGRQALVRKTQAGWLCGTGCLRLSLGNSVIEPLFLHYYLRDAEVIGWIANQAVGATLPNLNTGILRSVPVRLPPLPVQRKIAAILSAYDDLIENNLRRIKILEEMAQNLYREWFVKFRFPGHEHSRFVDSPLGRIPEGWDVTNLERQLITLESGKRPKGGIKDEQNGVPSVGAENILGIGRHNFQNEKYVSRKFFESMRKGVVKDGDVALYKDGAYIGKSSYFRNGFPHAEFCVNEHVFLLRTNGKRMTQNSLYLWLQEADTISAIRATNANAAQPGINQLGISGLPLVLPKEEVVHDFDQLVESNLALVVNLAKRNKSLRRTRDLLLPKLISGEVDVSELDIAFPEEAA